MQCFGDGRQCVDGDGGLGSLDLSPVDDDQLDIAERFGRKQVFSSSVATYWPKLTAVFKAISEGDDALAIPPYNGGLFSAESAQMLKRAALPDDIVAALIFGLN